MSSITSLSVMRRARVVVTLRDFTGDLALGMTRISSRGLPDDDGAVDGHRKAVKPVLLVEDVLTDSW